MASIYTAETRAKRLSERYLWSWSFQKNTKHTTTVFFSFCEPLRIARKQRPRLWRGLDRSLRVSNNCPAGGSIRDFENPAGFAGKWSFADICILRPARLCRRCLPSQSLLADAFCARGTLWVSDERERPVAVRLGAWQARCRGELRWETA